MHLSVSQLAREVRAVEGDGYDATPLRVDLHVKLAAPFACALLPLAVLLFAVGGPPFPGPAKTLLVGIALGVGFVLATGVAASLGHGGSVPAALAGWAPLLLLAALSSGLGLRARR